jgi:integrase
VATQARPWTASEARQFLAATASDPLHAAFVLLILYGLRRGEVLGLRWNDIDFDAGTIHIRQQLQRIRGELNLGPVKTQAGQRNLPLLNLADQALQAQLAQQASYRLDMGSGRPRRQSCGSQGPDGSRQCPRRDDLPARHQGGRPGYRRGAGPPDRGVRAGLMAR